MTDYNLKVRLTGDGSQLKAELVGVDKGFDAVEDGAKSAGNTLDAYLQKATSASGGLAVLSQNARQATGRLDSMAETAQRASQSFRAQQRSVSALSGSFGAYTTAQTRAADVGAVTARAAQQARTQFQRYADAVRTAARAANDYATAAIRAERESRRLATAGRNLFREFFNLRNAIVGLGLGLAIRESIELADAWTNAKNRLNIYTTSLAETNEQLSDLFDLSQDARTGLDQTTALFNRLVVAQDSLGASTAQLMVFTEGASKALQLSGANAQSAAGAMLQLSQAIGTDTVRAEELNSIMENSPRLAKAAAEGIERMAGDVGKLRREILAGNVSSNEFFYGILSQVPQLRAEFEKMEITVSAAMTQLRNGLIKFAGGANEATGASKTLVGQIQDLTEWLETAAAQELAADLATLLADGARLAGDAISFLSKNLDELIIAGGALIGLRLGSVFGPWGALIGTAAGATLTWATAIDKATDAHIELERVINKSNALMKVENVTTLHGAEAHLKKARGVREETQAQLELQRTLLKGELAKEDKASGLAYGAIPGLDTPQVVNQLEASDAVKDRLRIIAKLNGELALQDGLIRGLDEQIAHLNVTSVGTFGGGGGSGRLPNGVSKTRDEFEKMRASVDKVFAANKQYREDYDKLVKAYEAGVVTEQEAYDTSIRLAEQRDEALRRAITGQEEHSKATRQSIKDSADYQAVLSEVDAILRDAASVYEATRTPAERYAATVATLNEYLRLGVIDQETHARAVDQAKDAYDRTEEAASRAAERTSEAWKDVSNDISGLFNDALNGNIRSFEDFADRLLEIWNRTALRLAQSEFIEPAAENLFGGLFGDASRSGGPGFNLGSIGNLLGGNSSGFSSIGSLFGLGGGSALAGAGTGAAAIANAGIGGAAIGGQAAGVASLVGSIGAIAAPLAAIAIPLILSQIDNGPRNIYARRYLTTDGNGNLVPDEARSFNWKDQAGADVFAALDELTGAFLDVTGQIESGLRLTLDTAGIAGVNSQGSAGANAGAFFAYFDDQEGQRGWVSLFDRAGDTLYATAQEALSAAIADVIGGGFLSSSDPRINRALSDASDAGYFEGLDGNGALAALQSVIGFVENFDDSLQALAAGGLNFAEAIGVSMRAEINKTISSLDAFVSTTADLGLSVADARIASREFLEVFFGLRDAPAALSAYQQAAAAIDALEQGLIEALPNLREFGATLAGIAGGADRQRQALADQFNTDTRNQYLALTDPAQLAIEEFLGQTSALYEDALAVGGDLNLVQDLVTAGWAALKDELAGTGEAISDAASDLANWQRIALQYRQFSAGLLLDDALSPLSARGRFEEAQRQFREAAANARGGDEEAYQRLLEIAQEYGTEARNYLGDSARYFEVFNEIQQTMDRTQTFAERQESIAARQMDELTRQTTALDSIAYTNDQIVQSLNDLARNFNLQVSGGTVVPRTIYPTHIAPDGTKTKIAPPADYTPNALPGLVAGSGATDRSDEQHAELVGAVKTVAQKVGELDSHIRQGAARA
ncbi:MAG: tape measure protein [Magnetospiraceae bacterium]